MNVIRILADWVFPPNVLDVFHKLYGMYVAARKSDGVLVKNKNVREEAVRERCFILGNAPTIKDLDLSLLCDECVFVMSVFYNHPEYRVLNHVYHSSVHLTGSKLEKDHLLWMKSIDDNSGDNVEKFFFGIEQKELIEKYGLFKGKDVYYIASANTKRSFDLSKVTKKYQTNVIQALEIAMYMGFKEIYLHSVNLNSVCENSYHHFFDRKLLAYKDVEVLDDGGVDLVTEARNLYSALKDIEEIRKYAEDNEIKIYITNPESVLKLFEFVEIKDVVGG